MAHFAKVENGIVTMVIVAEKDFIDSGVVGDPSMWIQTSYNTIAGVHKNGGTPLRKNYAAVGYTYDRSLDAFIPPQPYKSWVLDKDTCIWNPPIRYPNDGKRYEWSEDGMKWVAINSQGQQ